MTLHRSTAEAYLARIGARRPERPDAEALRRLQERHVMSVPFENIDCYLRRPLGLGAAAVDKIVRLRRGGGCYELNSAFGLLLESLGYPVTVLGARVFNDGAPGPPLRHLVLLVEADDTTWLVDAGFGFGKERNSRFPLRALDRSPQPDPHGEYVLMDAPDGDVDVVCDGRPLYRFERHPRSLSDFEPTLWWFLTAPRSPMLQALFCVLPTESGRVSLKDHSLVRIADGHRTTTLLEEENRVRETLAESFGIVVDDIPDFLKSPEELAEIIATEAAAARRGTVAPAGG
ncbi:MULTISPECIES: arylamine N-acetyltransferase family protein [Actinomadura]|uniref:Arylamine N-acetyltransferase n=1 Tax=Actinomadura yumaensis TaxID=111807 RepID=A0ABW2CKI2_9ACTN|nr:arylamine N-acetyltransferase [Actinomadura sp. J1-007]MWK36843.1 acetyltransferase [Actinomadura sp. J1-007]